MWKELVKLGKRVMVIEDLAHENKRRIERLSINQGSSNDIIARLLLEHHKLRGGDA